MNVGWFSANWEANWRSLQYFNLYRLILAGLFGLALVFPNAWIAHLHVSGSLLTLSILAAYIAAVIVGLLLSVHWQHRFNLQLTAQISVDIAIVSALMYIAGGVGSGLGVLLLVSLAAVSLVGRGRMVLFYAALATLTLLGFQLYGIWRQHFEYGSLVHAGLVSAAFFATAILARLLGQRVMVNEELARRRGIALENQILISSRVVERMLDGVLIVSRDGLINRYNPIAAKMLALGEEATASQLPPLLASALSEWQAGQGADALLFPGAEGRDLRARFERTASSDGEVLVFLEDFGRVKEQAQQLKLASLGRLTASIAHEIRNPLSAIGYAGELLREERRGEMQDRLLRILNDNVARLDRIVQDVLELGRQTRAQPEPLRLDEFCAAFLETFVQSEGIEPGIVVSLFETDATICFDRSHLHQVLWNLVSNALRYSRREPGSVRLRVSGAPSGRVELHVEDDGPGVPESARGQIFEPFFTTYHHGTGLGLFIARELCATNGAALELQPSPQGAHFMIAGRNDTCPTLAAAVPGAN